MHSQFPDWHRQPLLLATAELTQPLLVFKQFFQFHTLTQSRYRLRQWLVEAMHADPADAGYMITQCEEVLRVIEAAWVIYTRDAEKGNAEDSERPKTRKKKAISNKRGHRTKPRVTKKPVRAGP